MLNGWQRLFVVVSVLWILLIALLVVSEGNDVDLVGVRLLLGVASIPPLVLYALGLAASWIWRGFRSSGQAPQR